MGIHPCKTPHIEKGEKKDLEENEENYNSFAFRMSMAEKNVAGHKLL